MDEPNSSGKFIRSSWVLKKSSTLSNILSAEFSLMAFLYSSPFGIWKPYSITSRLWRWRFDNRIHTCRAFAVDTTNTVQRQRKHKISTKIIQIMLYRVGDLFFVFGILGALERQVSGQPELVLLHGLSEVPQDFWLGARPIGTAFVQ